MSVAWGCLFYNYKDPLLYLFAFLYYFAYAWRDLLYKKIRDLRCKVIFIAMRQ